MTFNTMDELDDVFRCCCPCIIFADDFDRSDNTNLGSDWVEVTGDSEIISNELSMPAGAVIATVVEHPIDHVSGSVQISIPITEANTKYRVIINYVDANNYVFGQLDTGADRLGLYNRSGGVDTLIYDVEYTAAAFSESLRICRTTEGAGVFPSGSTMTWGCLTDNGGRKAGIGNGSGAVTIEVDDFRFEETIETNDDCDPCICECEGHCLPKTLTLTLFGSDCCACWDGTTFSLVFQDDCLPELAWYDEGSTCDWDECANPGGSHGWKFLLTCDVSGDWTLCWDAPIGTGGPPTTLCPSSCPLGTGYAMNASAVTCNPLELIYPSEEVHGSPPPDPPDTCTYSFKITE